MPTMEINIGAADMLPAYKNEFWPLEKRFGSSGFIFQGGCFIISKMFEWSLIWLGCDLFNIFPHCIQVSSKSIHISILVTYKFYNVSTLEKWAHWK